MKNLTDTTDHSVRRNLTIVAVTVAALGFSSCSAIVDRATEKVVEEGVERAIEADSGENVELDFDTGDGTFRIETEDGSFAVDGEEGTFVLETEDGTFEGSGDEDGFQVTDENGTSVIDADFDEDDGSIEIVTDDGSLVAGGGEAAWDLWPTAIPRPELGGDVSVLGTGEDDGGLWLLVTGDVEGDPAEALDAYTDRLDGFTATEQGTNAESVWVNMTSDDYVLSIVVDGAFDPTIMSMTVSPAS